MVHPVVPQVQALADPLAASLGFQVVQVIFHTNQHPPVLRVDIRPLEASLDTSHADCEVMSQALETRLDAADLFSMPYVLEVSSPGVPNLLISDRDFAVFKGFPVEISVDPAYKGKLHWSGNLLGRDQEFVLLSQKGRQIQLPRASVQQVILRESSTP
jgi:ribosome maturation factor RimP